MRLIIEPNYEQLSKWAANYVAAKINAAQPTPEKPFVLGLPTGSSPLGMYKNLIELNKQGVVSFQNVITFNMDEYVGLPKEHPESYHSFMWNNFFSHFHLLIKTRTCLNGTTRLTNVSVLTIAISVASTKCHSIVLVVSKLSFNCIVYIVHPHISCGSLTINNYRNTYSKFLVKFVTWNFVFDSDV